MTINFTSDCTGSVTLTFAGSDATGRNIYGTDEVNGPGNPQFSIFWDQASGTWFAGLFGTGSPSDILYTTGVNIFSPNPPDSATEPYMATVSSGCNNVGNGIATVSGSGTQATAGTPCAGIGDDDMDGVCNDNDVCPGADDTIDDDGDNIPDCNDPNPGVFDGVSFDSPCIGGVQAFTFSGNDGTRNTYANTAQALEIVFDATKDRWEMRGSFAGGAVIYFNTLSSIPDPPSSTAMAWEANPTGGCTDVPTVTGTGTQELRCTNNVGDCPDDGNTCTEAVLDEDCNCSNVTIVNNPPTATCNPTIIVELDNDGNSTLAAADVDNGSVDDACGSIATLALDRTDFDCEDIGLSPITVTLTVTDNEGGTASCTSDISVEDNIAPTFTCTDITVDLDAAGEYFISDSDVYTRMVQNWNDNCAPAPVSFGSITRTITCANSASGTFTYFFGAHDGNGQEMTCISIVTINDPLLICDDAPTAICLATAVVQIDADGNPDASSINDGSTDDNTAAADLTFSISGDGLDCGDVNMPAQTVTLLVTDNVGQTSTCTSMVTVEDNIAPEVSCQNIAINLLADGTFNSGGLNTFFLNNVLTSFNDNCALGPDNEIGADQEAFSCNDLGINNEVYSFRDRPTSDPAHLDGSCDILLQVNDPLGACPGIVTTNCSDFEAFTMADGTYTLEATSFNNGSTADLGLYTLAFGDATATIGQTASDVNFNNVGHGQSFIAAQTGAIQKIKVRFAAPKSNATLFLYNSATGSGVAGSIGTPAYTQTGIELFASETGTNGAMTEISLTTPFPVEIGQSYSFVFEGNTNPYYSSIDTSYPDGEFIFNYDLSSGCCAFGDLVFEVDFIGQTTIDYTSTTTETVDIFAVDNQGNVSTACTPTFTLNDLCSFSQFNSHAFIISGDPFYCPNQSRTIGINATLAPGAILNWYRGTFANQIELVGTGTTATYIVPPSTSGIDYVVVIEGLSDCPTTEFVEYTELPETTPPTAVCQDVTVELNSMGMASLRNPVSSVSGVLNTEDPTYGRIFGSPGSCFLSSNDNVFFETFSFTVDAADIYTFAGSGAGDLTAALYGDGFNSADPCTNLIAYNNDGNGNLDPLIMIQLDLVPGDYTLVIAPYSNNDTSDYTIDISSNNGGNVIGIDPIINNGSSDNCGSEGLSFSLDVMNFSYDDIGENMVTLSVMDGIGNTSTCTAIVTVLGCRSSLDLTDIQSDNFMYESASYIESTQTIVSPSEVEYSAATDIRLENNFEVKSGAMFHAFIEGCSNSGIGTLNAIKMK